MHTSHLHLMQRIEQPDISIIARTCGALQCFIFSLHVGAVCQFPADGGFRREHKRLLIGHGKFLEIVAQPRVLLRVENHEGAGEDVFDVDSSRRTSAS